MTRLLKQTKYIQNLLGYATVSTSTRWLEKGPPLRIVLKKNFVVDVMMFE